MLGLTGGVLAAGVLTRADGLAAQRRPIAGGLVVGHAKAADVGNSILRDGGNAVDAAVAAALAAAVAAPGACGIGGYGGHMVIALKGGKKVTAIDFNGAAPAAARPDMFPVDASGRVRGAANMYGWRAAGVPGVLAGLQLALDRYGTRSLRQVLTPAIQIAEEGFAVPNGFGRGFPEVFAQARKDAASARLLFKDGEPLPGGAFYRNPDLAKMLETLAAENSVASFYRGAIGRHIAGEFQKHGGLVTARDMADYRAREVEPLELEWRGFRICTAPLTGGGITAVEALSILKMLEWDKSAPGPSRTLAFVEALRVAWNDRLHLCGDPQKTRVPVQRLLSETYAAEMAARVRSATNERKPLPFKTTSREQSGTVHLNSADTDGNMVALTLTHGNPFGACVTVDGLGLTLGHGMSRFDVEPAHPNAPGPGKRPLTNMSPTIVLRGGQPVLAVGAAGSRMIVNAVCTVVAQFVGLSASAENAIAAPRLHTEGNLDVTYELPTPKAEVDLLQSIGYRTQVANVANATALVFDPETRSVRAATRDGPIARVNV